MSLNVYMTALDLPQDIEKVYLNDQYFNLNSSLPKDPVIDMILHDIDNASWFAQDRFTSNLDESATIFNSMLSTGAKTVLNIYRFPNIYFSTIECGKNAYWEIFKLNRGIVILRDVLLDDIQLDNLDINFYGKQCHTIDELFDWVSVYESEGI